MMPSRGTPTALEGSRMDEAAPSTRQKALALNLDPAKYGAIAEIGAGQEVARWFFQVVERGPR